MTSPSPESSQELRYPPIRVNRSLASLDLNTLIMRSNPRRPEEARSALSLEDSSYEVLGESVFETSDDEGHTESLASEGGVTPDDVSSISDSDEFDDDYMDDASQHFPPQHADATDDPLDAHHVTSPGDSTFTELADKEMSESSHLRLEETVVTEVDDMDACGLIKEFDQTSGLPDVLQPYGCPEVRLTVRMALSQHFMSVSGSYRLLYIGDLPNWAEKDISRQIGTALDAPPSSSRFNIVRGQLEPSGPALDVDHCTDLKIQEKAGKPARALLTLDDGTQLTLGPGKATQIQGKAPLPDLVIFYHGTSVSSSSGPLTESEKFNLVRSAFRRQHIPSLDVALARPFGQCPEAFTFDTNSLRLCVEGRKFQDSDYEVQETLPIDIYDFIKIEPSQLNRHLACIKSHARMNNSSLANGEERSWHVGKTLQKIKKSVTRLDTWEWMAQRNFWMTVLALTAMVLVGFKTSVLLPVLPHSVSQVEIPSSIPSSISLSTPVASSITAAPIPVSSPPLPSVRSTPQDLTIVASGVQTKSRQGKVQQEKAGGFEVQVTGDHQFVLQHPKQFINGKRKPQFHIEVTRDSKDVPVRYNSTSGSTIVDLEHEYPLGLFNVSIVARSKPVLQQSFEIKLGSNKSTLAYLKDNVDRLSQTVKQDLALAQSNLRNITTAVTKSLQEGIIRFEDGAAAAFDQTRYWSKQVQDSTQSVAGHLQEAKKKAAHQLSAGTDVTKDLSETVRRSIQDCTSRATNLAHAMQDTMPDLWKLSRPVRTSATLLKARRNALRLQAKLQRKLKKKEKVAGSFVKKTCKMGKAGKSGKSCRKSQQSRVKSK
jgi:hypothetical protein